MGDAEIFLRGWMLAIPGTVEGPIWTSNLWPQDVPWQRPTFPANHATAAFPGPLLAIIYVQQTGRPGVLAKHAHA